MKAILLIALLFALTAVCEYRQNQIYFKSEPLLILKILLINVALAAPKKRPVDPNSPDARCYNYGGYGGTRGGNGNYGNYGNGNANLNNVPTAASTQVINGQTYLLDANGNILAKLPPNTAVVPTNTATGK